jgi:hypothetical protein
MESNSLRGCVAMPQASLRRLLQRLRKKGCILNEGAEVQPSGAKEAAEKVDCGPANLAGAEARRTFCGLCGTSKLVPRYKPPLQRSFSAAGKARVSFVASFGTTEVVPFQNIAATRVFPHAVKSWPLKIAVQQEIFPQAVQSRRRRWCVEGIFMSSRYFATVRRVS